MLRRARLLVSLPLLVGACGLEESGAGPASGGAGGGATGGTSAGGSGGTSAGGSGGTSLGGALGSGGAVGGTAGAAGSDAGADTGSDAGPDAEDAAIDAPLDAVGDGGLVTLLDGARIELPCTGVTSSTACGAGLTTKTFPFEGKAGVSYDVTLRFRGVVEENGYTCTTKKDHFCTGGMPTAAGWNVFSLKVGDPVQTYYLNAGTAGLLHCFLIDYQATIPIKGGASIELEGDAIDGSQVRNFDGGGTPIVVPGVSPAPQAFDGQFIRIDVVSIVQK